MRSAAQQWSGLMHSSNPRVTQTSGAACPTLCNKHCWVSTQCLVTAAVLPRHPIVVATPRRQPSGKDWPWIYPSAGTLHAVGPQFLLDGVSRPAAPCARAHARPPVVAYHDAAKTTVTNSYGDVADLEAGPFVRSSVSLRPSSAWLPAPRLPVSSQGGLATTPVDVQHRRRRCGPPLDPVMLTVFFDLCSAHKLPVPDSDHLDTLRQAGTHYPDSLEYANLKELCAALVWVNTFLESNHDLNEWSSLPVHMQKTLLSLYRVPPQRPLGPLMTDWERLAESIRVYSPLWGHPASHCCERPSLT